MLLLVDHMNLFQLLGVMGPARPSQWVLPCTQAVACSGQGKSQSLLHQTLQSHWQQNLSPQLCTALQSDLAFPYIQEDQALLSVLYQLAFRCSSSL